MYVSIYNASIPFDSYKCLKKSKLVNFVHLPLNPSVCLSLHLSVYASQA